MPLNVRKAICICVFEKLVKKQMDIIVIAPWIAATFSPYDLAAIGLRIEIYEQDVFAQITQPLRQ